MPIPRDLADALIAVVRERMAEQGMTATTLAERIGLAQTTLARKLRGLGDLTLDEVDAIAVVLGEPRAEELLTQARSKM